jgi:hypothetical protein
MHVTQFVGGQQIFRRGIGKFATVFTDARANEESWSPTFHAARWRSGWRIFGKTKRLSDLFPASDRCGNRNPLTEDKVILGHEVLSDYCSDLESGQRDFGVTGRVFAQTVPSPRIPSIDLKPFAKALRNWTRSCMNERLNFRATRPNH